MSQTTIQTAGEMQLAEGMIPRQRTVERETSPGTTTPERQTEPAAPPLRRIGRRALGALLRRGAPVAEQVEHAAASAAWARHRPIDGHPHLLMVDQPFLRGLR